MLEADELQNDDAMERQVHTTNTTDGDDETCGICLEDIDPMHRVGLSCGHAFCYACLKEYQSKATLRGVATDVSTVSCPYCRTQIEDNVDSVVIDRALLLISRSIRQKNHEHATVAVQELEKVLDVEPNNIGALIVMADAHCALDKPDVAVTNYERVLEIDEDSFRVAGSSADSPVKFRLGGHGPVRLFGVKLKLAEAHMQNRDWEAAKAVYISMLELMVEPTIGTPPQQRQVFMGMARCAYHFQEYDRAVAASEAAIEMNRLFPDVRIYMFLAQRDSGVIESARATLHRAAIYEAPWDAEHQSKLKQLLEEFSKEHAD